MSSVEPNRMMKVLLVNPPPTELVEVESGRDIVAPPLGLACLAAALERAGEKVQVLDAFALGMSFDDLEREIKSKKPDLVGVTGMTPIIESAFRTVEIARRHSAYVVLGGAHASALGAKVFEECPHIDALIVGEAEESLVLFVRAIADGESNWSNIPGIITKESKSPERPVIQDLDSLPFPARRLLPMDLYRHPLFGGDVVATMISSRGCPYQCIFCDKSIAGSKWRHHSAEYVVQEIEEIVARFGIRSLIFYDDLFTLDSARVIEICERIIERGLEVKWKCEGRVNLVDDEALKMMKRAGCKIIAYGVETAHQKGLDYLNKGVTIEQIEDAFRRTGEAGIQTLAYFILGIPVESFEEELETIRFARRLKADYAQFATLSPFPGSRLYQEAMDKGWYQERPAFSPGQQGTRRPMIITEEWTERKLRDISKRAYRSFYYRPGYILKRLARLRSLRQLRAEALGALRGISGT